MKLEFFYLLKQCQPSSCILSKCLCQIKSAHRGDEGGIINEDRISSFSLVQVLLKTCHEILVLEVIGDYCSRQRPSVQQRVGSVHYQFKLPLEIFIWEGI